MDDQDTGYDRILSQATALLAERGDEQAVALMVDVRFMTLHDTDEVIGTRKIFHTFLTGDDGPVIETFYRREAVLDVADHLVPAFTEEVRGRIAAALGYVAERNGEENVAYVRPRPALPEVAGDWRKAYLGRQARGRPSNQARRESAATVYPVEDGMTFGSDGETRVYRVLKRLQSRFPEHDTIAIAPLPAVRLRAGHTWSPDLLVMGRGHVLIVETDGPHHRSSRRYADDRNRDLQWQRCGVPVVRLAVEDLDDGEELAARLNEEVLRHIRRRG